MGAPDDPRSVVDPQGRVLGVDGLWVADASVFPEAPRANTNLPTIAAAERLSDLGGRAVAGSNPVSPTSEKALLMRAFSRSVGSPISGLGSKLGSNFFLSTPIGHREDVRTARARSTRSRAPTTDAGARPMDGASTAGSGPKRSKGGSDGLTRAQAEQVFRRLQAEEATRPVEPVVEIVTVDQAAERLRRADRDRGRAAVVPPEL